MVMSTRGGNSVRGRRMHLSGQDMERWYIRIAHPGWRQVRHLVPRPPRRLFAPTASLRLRRRRRSGLGSFELFTRRRVVCLVEFVVGLAGACCAVLVLIVCCVIRRPIGVVNGAVLLLLIVGGAPRTSSSSGR